MWSLNSLTFWTMVSVAYLLHAVDEASHGQHLSGHVEDVVVVVGAEGEPHYGEEFSRWAARWREAAEETGRRYWYIGPERDSADTRSDRDALADLLARLAPSDNNRMLWVILIGHGTYDGRAAKFNLRGPDISSRELADWLSPIRRPMVIMACFSCSGAFLSDLRGSQRVIITATRSGAEVYYSRFGGFLAECLTTSPADLDKDEQISVLELFLTASRMTEEFYRNETRLATEHALIDDNGDGKGTAASAFRGVRFAGDQVDGSTADGSVAHQVYWRQSIEDQNLPEELREKQKELELAIEMLRKKKHTMNEQTYYAELEQLLLQIIRLRKTEKQ